jgi:hypothetical protein
MRLFHFHRAIGLSCVVILSLVAPDTLGQSKRIGAYKFRASKKNHNVRLVITNAPFDPSKHKVGHDQRTGENLIDGRVAYGAEAIPRTQIKSIALYFDGQRINIAHPLYADCFNPNLELEYVKLRFGRDLQTVFVTMDGADGAGAYIVVWALRRNGRHTRTFKPAF